MKYFLDISLALIVLATVIYFWHKGLIRSVLGTVKTILAVVLAYIFGPKIALFIESKWLSGRIGNSLYQRFLTMCEEGSETVDLTNVLDQLPDWLRILLKKLNVDFSSVINEYGTMTEGTMDSLRQMSDAIAQPIERVLSQLLGYAVVFFAALLVLTLLVFLLGKIADLPIIRSCDRFLGFLLGVLCAYFYASAYTVLLGAILTLIETTTTAISYATAFESTILFQRFYQFNLFRLLFGIG